MEQNRFRSPVVWTSIIALIVSILLQLGVIGDGTQITQISATIIELLCVVGILNNPTDKEHF